MSLENHVTTTADCWSIFKRSYIDITGHWINNSLIRVSCLLGIKRLKGKHTYDVLAKKNGSLYTKFDTNNKISHTITDNVSNFVKSYKVYAVNNKKDYSSRKSNLNAIVNEVIEMSDEKENID
uniref:Uncharacterized protein n=1 Tax=Sipha flava TaxID=143950 RepID=A0A2S2Q5J0_9HEMI